MCELCVCRQRRRSACLRLVYCMPTASTGHHILRVWQSQLRGLNIQWCVQVTVQVCVFAFDLLYADGQPLVKLSLRERRARMAAAFPSRWGVFFILVTAFVQLGQRCDVSLDSVCRQGRCGGCTWNAVSGDAAATRHVACMSGVSCNTLSSRSATHTVLQPRGRSATGFRWPDLHMMTAFNLATPQLPAGTHLCIASATTDQTAHASCSADRVTSLQEGWPL